MITRNLKLALLLSAASALVLAPAAQAASTTAGTSIANTATVGYTVGGTPQSPVTSNTATFLVDRKVNLTVAEVGGSATVISYGDTAKVTTFQVTNLTNATQDFRLQAAQQLSLIIDTFGLTDSIDMSNVHVFVDGDGDGLYEAGTDTATFIDELAPDAQKTVFIVADAPASGPASGDAGVGLIAYTATGSTPGTLGGDVAATIGVDSPTAVDTVFADTNGPLDLLHDGDHSALDAYVTASTTVGFAKTATVISDPIDGSLLPKAIPGAIVEYCLKVSNTGGSSATAINITDSVPANTTYVANSLVVGGSVLLGACLGDGTTEDDNATGADETDLNGGSSDGATIHAMIPAITAGATQTARFRVTLN
ncbi:MAG: hypothetical protein WDN06_05520 [Asticcacaulis sp.]